MFRYNLRLSIYLFITLFCMLLISPLKAEASSDTGKNSYDLISDKWMSIYFKGQKLGFSNTIVYEGKRGYKVTGRAIIRMKAFGVTQETSFNQETFLNKDLRAERFIFTQDIGGHRQYVEGKVDGDVLYLEISSAGVKSKKKISFGANTFLAGTLELVYKKKGLSVGNKYLLKVFMEPIQSLVDINFAVKGVEKKEISGEVREIYHVEHKFKNISTDTWMTADGETFKETSLEGIESIKEDKEKAIKFPGEPIPISSFITFSLIRTKRDITEPRKTKYLKIRIKGISDPSLIPEDKRQRILNIESVREGIVKKYNVEMEIRMVASGEKPRPGSKELSATPYIQSDYAEIKKLGLEITGKETVPLKKAELISNWVFNYLDKKMVDTFSAVDALHSKEGECQSHANLFAALARSAGIPTKIVSGLVYSDTDGGFLYHAWAEVYDRQWIPMDPTFGLLLTDATHIKLVEGGWENQLNLLHFIGRVGIDVLGVRFKR